MNLRTSSISMTGRERSRTKSHSLNDNGTMLKMSASHGTYRIRKCSPKDTAHASSKYGFLYGGICSKELSYRQHKVCHLHFKDSAGDESDFFSTIAEKAVHEHQRTQKAYSSVLHQICCHYIGHVRLPHVSNCNSTRNVPIMRNNSPLKGHSLH